MNLPQTTAIAKIVIAANEVGRKIPHKTLHKNEFATLILRADERGQLLIEVWPKGMGPVTRLTLATWDYTNQQWIAATDQATAEQWLVESRRFFNIETEPVQVEADELPTVQHPADAAADELLAERPDASDAFRKRLARAVEMIKFGTYNPDCYNTADAGATYYPNWVCDCPDAEHRNLRDARLGQVCKHTLAGEIARRIEWQADAVAQRHLRDKTDRARQTAHVPAQTAHEPAEKPWWAHPDPINRSRAGAGNAQFRPAYGS